MNDIRIWLRDTAERVVVTFIISIAAVFSGDWVSDWHTDGGKKITAAVLVAAAVAMKQIILPPRLNVSEYIDILYRAGWSAVQHVLMLQTAAAGFDWFSITAWQTAAVGGIAAALSVVKGALAARMNKPTVTPASLAPA